MEMDHCIQGEYEAVGSKCCQGNRSTNPNSGERAGLEVEIHVTKKWDCSPRMDKIQQEENGEGCGDSSSFEITCCSSRGSGFSS